MLGDPCVAVLKPEMMQPREGGIREPEFNQRLEQLKRSLWMHRYLTVTSI